MNFTMELVLTILASACWLALFMASALASRRGRLDIGYFAVLVSPLPVWFFTHLLWGVTRHGSPLGYPFWWFWFPYIIGWAVTFVALLSPWVNGTVPLAIVQLIACFLLAVMLWNVNWFAPKDFPFFNSKVHTFVTLAVILGVVAIMLFVWWLIRRKVVMLAIAAIFAVALAIASLGIASLVKPTNGRSLVAPAVTPQPADPKASSSSSASSSPNASTVAVTCTSWAMTTTTPSNGNWVLQGVPSIQKAKTVQQARAAITDWVNKIKGNPSLLSATSAYMLHKPVNPNTLISHGCATTAAVNLVNELSVALALAEVSPSQAPANGYNTGTHNGAVFANNQPGISGNRKAVKVVLKDGTVLWVMARCGNPVTVTKPPIHMAAPPNTATTPRVCVKRPAPGPNEMFNSVTCQWYKKAQTWECMQNGGPNCPPNPAHQNPQRPGNHVQATATLPVPGVSTKPTHQPVQPVNTGHPGPPNNGGYNGGSTSNPIVSGTPKTGKTQTHTSAVPTPSPTCTDANNPFCG